MQKHFFGILPAVVTPVDEAGNFQAAPFARLLARLYAAQVHGIYVCGLTGEGWQQSVAQRMRVAEAAMEHSPAGKQVIVHVGAMSTNDAVTLARHASAIGAAAVSSLPPAGGLSFVEVREYYRALAEASSVPLLVYYFPSLAPAITQLDQLLELCALPNVAGLKFTDSDFYKLSWLARSGAVVFNGSDEMLATGLLRGACGGIGSIYNLVSIILRYPVLAAVKTLLAWSGLDCGPCIKPRRDLTPAELSSLREQIAASSFAGRFGLTDARA
ncbi:MAG: dihydrodipicolinate synthase family protein [Candidatus Solibacter usitatus]|nr:dihydrodipicolinate synthase family protein [Candidatus Solibacter usitatus]